MKKFLSLVLALVMTMSLVTVAGAKDFTDDSKITYKEAVDVMTATGIVGGYADGSFAPTATLTRGAAAKIICNMIMGPTNAEVLAANEAPYKDVPADHTFAGYIAYLSNEGIISGYADGTFRPSATLTGYAFWKMLLGALGYDAAIENYTGTNWAVAVAKRGMKIGLDDGLNGKFVGTKALTREEACLYAFNALNAYTVEYADKGTNFTLNGMTVNTGASAAKENTEDGYYYEILFDGDLKKDGKVEADAYGRPAHAWKYKKDAVGTYADDAIVSYTEAVEFEDLVDDLDDEGYEFDTTFTMINAKSTTTKTVKSYKDDDEIGGAGTLVEVYGEDDVVTKIVVIETYLDKVTDLKKDKTSTTKVDERAIVLETMGTIKYEDEQIDNFDEIYKNVEEDDYVLYTKNTDGEVETLIIPETIEGKVTKVTSSEATVDGVKYTIAQNCAGVSVDSKKQTIWLDTYGNVIKGEADEDETNYVYVVAKYDESDKWNDTTYYVQGVTTDGKAVELELKDKAASDKIAEGTIYEYSTDSKGVATLDTTSYKTLSNGTIETSATKYDKKYFADEITFIYVDGKGSDLESKAVEGVQKLTISDEKAAYAIMNDDDEIEYIYVAGSSESATAEDLIFVEKAAGYVGTAMNADDEKGYTFTFYLNGEEMTEIVADATASTKLAQGFYEYSVNDDGEYELKLVDKDVAIAAYNQFSIVKDKYVSIDGTKVDDYTLDGEIYDLSDNDIDSLAELKEMNGDTEDMKLSIAVVFDTDDEVITAMYIF